MKNISKLLACGFMGLVLASCDGNYDDWSQPQQNPQEDAVVLPAFTATAAQPIDFDQVTTDSVDILTLSTAALPEGYELGNGRIELVPQGVENAAKQTVNVSTNGRAAVADLLGAVTGVYGKKPVERTLLGNVYYNAINNGQAALINAGQITLKLTPRASEYTFKYYLVGALQGWSDATKSCLLYPETQAVQSYTTQWTGDANFKLWADDDFGNWNKALGSATDGDNSVSGALVSTNAGTIVCPEPGAYYTVKFDLEAKTYTWTKLDNQTPTEYTNISLIGDFNTWSGDVELTQVTPHNWTAVLETATDGGLKFRANLAWDVNWGCGVNVANQYYGLGVQDGDNITVPAGKYNVFFNDITGEFAFVAE